MGSSSSTCSSVHGDGSWAPDSTHASDIVDPIEVEQLLSPDDKAYVYGHDGFPYGYSDTINVSDSFYGLAPGSSKDLDVWNSGQAHFRQDPYQGHASTCISVEDTAEGRSAGGRSDRKRHTCC